MVIAAATAIPVSEFMIRRFLFAIGLSVYLGPSVVAQVGDREVDFATDIRPLLRASCYSCHSGENQESGLRLDLEQRAFDGGDRGPAIFPGDSEASLLIRVVTGRDEEIGIMPPEGEGTPLSQRQISLLRRWIDRGADWTAADSTVTESSHWAFLPVQPVALPQVTEIEWLRNSIDAFILARLEAEQIGPSPEADRPTLIRRLYLDLLGLPPSPRAVRTFVSDPHPNAYSLLVDRVLASPHFGERWGRHWLDIARYADSDGYEKDRARPFAWRYRNWVIDSLNADLPYDQFTVHQIAGDMLPNASKEQIVASGFHRNTLHNTEGGVDQEEDRVKKTVDRTNTVGAAWLGLTVGCAQCHSHKYDPFTQREYYSFYGFFNDIDERQFDAPLPLDIERVERERAAFDAELQRLKEQLSAYERTEFATAQASWERMLAGASQADGPQARIPEAVSEALRINPADRTPKQRDKIQTHFRSIDPKLTSLQQRIKEHEKSAPAKTLARVVAELDDPRTIRVHVRGDFLNPGALVRKQTPAVLPPLAPRGDSADRLDLARWLASVSNPLTPRVAVNRIWHRVFGRGIVKTVDDFGTQGDFPTHPALLDWLAAEFVRADWSVKAVIRRIVNSSTYRQSSATRSELVDSDPENALLARQYRRRVESEVIRDLALTASGLLDARIGGPSVRPRQPAEYANLTYANSAKWVVSSAGDAYRRGLYTFFQRTSPYPMLMTFDAPDSNACCATRSLSNTPLQALTLWNDPVFFECAQALGRRIAQHRSVELYESDLASKVSFAYLLCLSRAPSPDEVSDVLELYRDQQRRAVVNPATARAIAGVKSPSKGEDIDELAAWTIVARTLLNLDEFISKE